MNGYRQMANGIHVNTIGSTVQDEFRSGFAVMPWTKNMSGMSFFNWARRSCTCVSCQFVLGYSATIRSKSCKRSRRDELPGESQLHRK